MLSLTLTKVSGEFSALSTVRKKDFAVQAARSLISRSDKCRVCLIFHVFRGFGKDRMAEGA